jgi:hypothetical protein
MKSIDSLIPYILASMHPLMHMTLLITGFTLVQYDKTKFYEVPENIPKKTQAYYFATEGKFFYMFLIMTAHLGAIVLHYAS